MEVSRNDLKQLEKALADEGRPIEAGWMALRFASLPLDTPPDQLEQARSYFFAGAHHIFTALLGLVPPDGEPTDDDVVSAVIIQSELDAFIAAFAGANLPSEVN